MFRICRDTYSPLDPTGAARTPGRWNMPGQRVLYFSSSLALGVLELHANGAPFSVLRTLYHYLHVDDVVRLEAYTEKPPDDLYAGQWRNDTERTRLWGGKWYREARSVLLKVRSAVLPVEHNIIVNTLHPDFGVLNFTEPSPLPLDTRLP